MRQFTRFIIVTLLVVNFISFLSCKQTDSDKIYDEALKAAELAAKQAKEIPEIAEDDPLFASGVISEKKPVTTLELVSTKQYDFGVIKQNDKVSHDFLVKNTGKNPLIISNCKATCGCTIPNWQKTPIMPTETSKIHVVFDSQNKIGKQLKAITVYTNTEPPQTILTLTGMVEK